MSSSKVVGRLRAVLGLDKRNFQQGLRDGENDLKRFSSVAQAVGGRLKMALGLSVAGFGLQQLASQAMAAVRSVAELGDEAKRSGMSLRAFQEWKYVAEQNRIGIDAVVDGFKELNLRADEFIETGGGSASDAFKRLGFSAQDLKKKLKDPSALMLEIIGRMEDLNKAAQIRIADELLGGAGGEQFVQLLQQGEAGIRKSIDAAHEFGAVLTEEMVQKADELDRKWKVIAGTLGAGFEKAALHTADFILWLSGLEKSLDSLLGDEGRARTILGNDVYEELKKNQQAVDQNAESIEGLDLAVQDLQWSAHEMAVGLAKAAQEAAVLGNTELEARLMALANEMNKLQDEFNAGNITAEQLATGLLDVADEADNTFKALSQADQVSMDWAIEEVGRLGGALRVAAGMAQSLVGWMAKVSGVGVPATDAPSADEGPVLSELAPTDGRGARPPQLPTVDSYGNWQEANQPKGGKGGGGKSRDEYAAAIESSRQQVAMLTVETAALLAAASAGDKYGGSVDYAKKKAELLMAAQKQGLTITPALTAEIDAQARAYATAGLAAEEAADRLREIDEAMERGEDSARDFFGALLDGSDAAKNAIISLLAEMAKAQFASGALGLLGSFGGGGFLKTFGTLLGGGIPVGANSTGTLNWRGGLSRVNELGGEILDLPKGTRVIPADVSKRMADQSGAQAVDVHVTVGMDESGNLQVRNIARQEASSVAGELNRALPSRIAEINARNPRMRG
ncbi:phage tail tape measure protein [Pseudogemmobacter faecipullorum]|uniref:Uncharacterized protein n=1 Tax=Pseudogemmobacter faecipullorum TaxID=2755041 RepID=A0ABS8CSF9_9RHOB|nr:phage tail tape measure protein [Pseudogemmobacter faecipullorum]MCB5412346.1 hypothetical protein [Pseudogemmobacter faecipullorum]